MAESTMNHARHREELMPLPLGLGRMCSFRSSHWGKLKMVKSKKEITGNYNSRENSIRAKNLAREREVRALPYSHWFPTKDWQLIFRNVGVHECAVASIRKVCPVAVRAPEFNQCLVGNQSNIRARRHPIYQVGSAYRWSEDTLSVARKLGHICPQRTRKRRTDQVTSKNKELLDGTSVSSYEGSGSSLGGVARSERLDMRGGVERRFKALHSELL